MTFPLHLLLLAVILGGATTADAARNLLIDEPALPPLRIKISGCFDDYPSVPAKIAADIAAVDAYAAANGRQRLTYAGIVSNLITELGSFDMLFVYNWACFRNQVFTELEQPAVETALADGTLKKLMVWQSWNDAALDSRVPGMSSSIGCSNWNTWVNDISASPALYASVGPNPPSCDQTIYGDPASCGICPASGVQSLTNSVAHAWDSGDPSHITAFSFCHQGRGAVFYSQMVMDYHLQNNPSQPIAQFHANAISVFSNSCTCLPIVTVSGVPATICEDASSVLLSFTANSNDPGAGAIDISSITLPDGAACSGPSSATAGQAFSVNCPKGSSWPTTSPFSVTVAASQGAASCAGSASGSASVTVTRPADVVLSATWLPPNNKMFDVSLTNVPLQDPALPGTVTVSSVEFFDVLKGRRPTFPLAVISPSSSVVSLRAERNGAGSGRLYRIKYTTANAAGSCSGVAFVCVPHDASAFNPLGNGLAAAGQTKTAPKPACPIPGSIEEAQWMPTTAP